MAWFWTASRDGDGDGDEEEDEDDDDQEDEEFSSEEELSEGEEFAEDEENYDDDEDADAIAKDDPRRHDETTIDVTKNQLKNVVGGQEKNIPLLLKESDMERRGRSNGINADTDDDNSYLREEEFAQLVAHGESSSSSLLSFPLNRSNSNKVNGQSPFHITNETNHHSAATAKTTTPTASPLENHPNTTTTTTTQETMENEEEEVTTLEEKQSLLILAAEHDRVDILQAILSSSSSSGGGEGDDDMMKKNRHNLLHGVGSGGGDSHNKAPPLHIAVAHGSVNAVNCLLRMGADPSIRSPSHNNKTAWEVAFDTTNNNNNNSPTKTTTTIAPSKREGIRHAFTAEALRCIGADEVERLQQLLQAGLPKDCDVGGRSLAEWTVDLGASQCQALVGEPTIVAAPSSTVPMGHKIWHEEGLPALENRLDELNNLSKALSQFLDNLAEEVSVCSGLLLVGSGAAALAAHVKSLKQQKIRLQDDLERHAEGWENSEDELAYWVRECGGMDILKTLTTNGRPSPPTPHHREQTSGSSTEEEQDATRNNSNIINQKKSIDTQQLQRLKTQIAACETKIRMLRASIADLSDENQRNLLEVERRGLQGGVRLVRTLRQEIVELEFQLAEIDSGEAACRAKIQLLQQYIKTNPMITNKPTKPKNDSTPPTTATQATGEAMASTENQDNTDDEAMYETTTNHYNNKTALIVRPQGGNHGFLPFSIWQLFLRIMGLSHQPPPPPPPPVSYHRPAVIV